MKSYVKIHGKSQYGDFEDGDRGVVDGYLCNGTVPYAVVINCQTRRFNLVEIWRLEFEAFGQTQENMGADL